MIFQFLIISLWLEMISQCQTISISSKQIGCLDSSCQKLCRIGYDICDPTQISCSFGYFLFQNRECVRCPYQQYNSKLTVQCQECLENPYSWDQSRSCQNYYTIYNADEKNGVFINQQNIDNNLYFVEAFEGTTISPDTFRNYTKVYDLNLCEGCSSFCTPQDEDESCYLLSEISSLDPQQGIECNDGFFFSSDSCKECPSSCMVCYQENKEILCSQCNDGYALDASGVCQQCFTNCVDCYYENDIQFCLECVQTSLSNFLIPSPDQKSCQTCSPTCARCEYQGPYRIDDLTKPLEYITRDQTQLDEDLENYPQRCRQCLYPGQYLTIDGKGCSHCLIPNCLACYQEQITNGKTYRTNDLDFRAHLAAPKPLCSLCAPNYLLSLDKKSCGSVSGYNTQDNCAQMKLIAGLATNTYLCVRCKDGFILNLNTDNSNICSGNCTQKLHYCINCISYVEKGSDYHDLEGHLVEGSPQTIYQCIKCQSGYYPDFFTGECMACPNRCKTCWQYSASYNHTAYVYGYTTNILSKKDRVPYGSEPNLDPMCTECENGFNLYDGQCLGCTSKCKVNGVNKCEYTDTFAYCSQCENSQLQKSLDTDLSQCNQCPYNCIACRNRTDQEFNSINPLFNPQNDELLKFANLCYKLASTSSDEYAYIDTKTMIPITCARQLDNTKPQTLCQTQSKISVIVYCDAEADGYLALTDDQKAGAYSLQHIFTKKKTAQLKFLQQETYDNFEYLNKNSVYSLTLEVNFIPDNEKICTFKKPTKLVTQFQQNVFSLQNFQVVFQSFDAANRVKFKLYGNLEFDNINILQFQNIDLAYENQEPKSKTPLKYFGIQLSGSLTEFIVTNQKIDKSETPQASFSYTLKNTYNLIINNLELSHLDSKDDPFNQSFTVNGFNYSLVINGLIITSCDLTNNSFIQMNPDQYNFININNLKIQESTISNMTLFWSFLAEGYIQLQVNGIKIFFSKFLNSTVIQSDYIIQSKIANVDVIQSYFNNSNFVEANQLVLENFYIMKCIFANQSNLIASTAEFQNSPIYNTSINLYSFNNLIFVKPSCYDINCLIFISTPSNKFGIKTDITIQNVQVSGAEVDMSHNILEYVNSALIYFLNVGRVNIVKIKSIYNLALTVFTFQNVTYININNMVCDWNNSNYQYLSNQERDIVQEFLIPDPGDIQVLNPFNDLIQVSKDCVEQSLASLGSNQFCLYISDFSIGVQIQNVYLNRLFLIDTAAIYIESYKVLEFNTTQQTPYVTADFYNGYQNEVIIISNLYGYNNTILKYDQGQSIGLIGIKSQQLQTIILTNLTYLGNHMHFYTGQIFPSAVILFIDSQQGNIQITNFQSKENRATNSPNGLIYVVSENLTIQSSSFTATNIISEQWLYYMAENQFTDNNQTVNNMREFFKILSIGANINADTQNLYINQTYFQDSNGLDGAGLFINTKGQGIINIQNTQFINQIGSLEQKYATYGGCLYVDASESNLTLQLINVKMINCVSRSQGGCIYVDTSKYSQSIRIQSSLFQQCQSLDGSILYAQFPDSSEQTPEIDIDESTMTDNNLKQFLSQIPSLSQQEQQSFQSTASAIRMKNGMLKMQEIIISNMYPFLNWKTQLNSIFHKV